MNIGMPPKIKDFTPSTKTETKTIPSSNKKASETIAPPKSVIDVGKRDISWLPAPQEEIAEYENKYWEFTDNTIIKKETISLLSIWLSPHRNQSRTLQISRILLDI